MNNGGEVATNCPPCCLALLLGRKKKVFTPKHMITFISLTSPGMPQFPLPVKQLCQIHAGTQLQAEDSPPRQHLLPEQCPAWRPGAPGARNLSLLFVIQMNPWGGGEAWRLHSSWGGGTAGRENTIFVYWFVCPPLAVSPGAGQTGQSSRERGGCGESSCFAGRGN